MLQDFRDISDIQNRIGYQFKDASLLRVALTHSSYANENSLKDLARGCPHNETLEFLGDAILGFVIAEHLYMSIPKGGEGDLTKKRAAIVCEKSLAKCARSLNIGKALKLGRSIQSDKGFDKPSILSDAMEAIFAAVYLDSGLETTREVILSCLEDVIRISIEENPMRDFKTYLQEMLHNKKVFSIEYAVIKETGPDHNKTFTSQVTIEGKSMGTGTGGTKKESEQNAAKQAIEAIGGRKELWLKAENSYSRKKNREGIKNKNKE
ncbi:MAG: ribonuclease III [Oscillospiraceae bacterium]|nr:ribonuclease III [Oscillospiraceae bacterium]